MPATVRPAGALLLARELRRGAPNPSLIHRFHAHNDPHRVALIVPGEPGAEGPRGRDRAYSYFELDRAIDRAAAALHGAGVGRGDVILTLLENRLEAIVLPAAAGRIGASVVTASYRSSAAEAEHLASHSRAKVAFVDAEAACSPAELRARVPRLGDGAIVAVGGPREGAVAYADFLARTPADVRFDADPEAAAVVIYTSGTTGKPKGAVRRFPKAALASALAIVGETPMRLHDVHLCVCPLYHTTAFGFVTFTFLLGGAVVLPRRFEPERFLALVERHRVAHTAVVPTMLSRLVALGREALAAHDASSLVAIFSGGAPLPASLATATMDALGDTLWNFYGATETGLVTLARPADLRAAPNTIGRLVPGNAIRLLDEHGHDVPVGAVGELYARSELLVDGYRDDPAATNDALKEGFFSVGDLARVDHEGRYFLEGRKRDLIISGGVNVYPAEVEAALDAHPGIAEAAVVGVPDPEWGERVRAFVVRKLGAELTSDDVRAHCRSLLAGPKVPRDVVFLDELPRNPTGKVLKRALRERA